jgi:beta-phosphoglucomutase-like phosphatase (HAD superfamily)
MLSNSQALIFDCDGTLVDSAPLYAEAWGAGFAVSGGVMTDHWYHDRNGLSEHVLMQSFEDATGLTLDRSATIATMREAFLTRLTVLREIAAVADIARAAKGIMPLAVASGGPRAIVEPSLRHTGLADLFCTIVTLDDVGIPKPQPDLFLEAARRLGVEPASCLVMEDSVIGFKAAETAGMRCLDVRESEQVKTLLFDLAQAQQRKQASQRD